LYYAPDPASQQVSTVGGNVATNAGGPHCLKYGVTLNHVLGLVVVLHDGMVVTVGGEACDAPDYDLAAVIVGSEGTLGIATEICVRLCPKPETVSFYRTTTPRVEARRIPWTKRMLYTPAARRPAVPRFKRCVPAPSDPTSRAN